MRLVSCLSSWRSLSSSLFPISRWKLNCHHHHRQSSSTTPKESFKDGKYKAHVRRGKEKGDSRVSSYCRDILSGRTVVQSCAILATPSHKPSNGLTTSIAVPSTSTRSIYHKTNQVYTEKEIIALAAKAGVNANSIPEIHQSLVDDALVEKEKIGGSNYCFSFKAKKDRVAQKAHQQTLDVIQELKPKVEEASADLADAKRGREEEDGTTSATTAAGEGGAGDGDKANTSGGAGGRAAKLRRMTELEKRKTAIQAELDSLKENDPAALADLEKELKLVIGAAHRWTDNIFECKTYLIKKRGMEKKEAGRILGITSNFDCKLCVSRRVTGVLLLLPTCLLPRHYSFVLYAIAVSRSLHAASFPIVTYRPRRQIGIYLEVFVPLRSHDGTRTTYAFWL
jgi:hypothetical protein